MATFDDYKSLTDKHSWFQYKEAKPIVTETEFRTFLTGVFKKEKSAIFRGVGEAKWKIISSCQRAFLSGKVYSSEDHHKDQNLFINREIKQIKEMSDELLPKYYNELGVPVTDFIYLSFLQHYGAATTLIDFSKNHKTALWMAVNSIQYPTISEKDIDNYFSIYWIEKNDIEKKIPSVLEKYQESYLKHAIEITNSRCSEKSRNSYKLSSDLQKVIDDKHSVLKQALDFIKWDNYWKDSCLANIKLGIIHTSNKSHHDRRLSLEHISDEMQKTVHSLSKNMSESAYKAFRNIVYYLFNETIRIANLNLVAQEGCFIHYLPDSYETPLEGNSTMKGIIYCVDIHKSLAPFILNTLNQNGVNQDTMFPDSKKMAQRAFKCAQSLDPLC
jgi:hypothetical protein